MPQAILDPDDLVYFAGDLQDVSARISDEIASASSAFDDLHELWKDRKYDRFARTFEESVHVLRGFCDEAQLYADFLREKARLAEEYLHG